MKKTGENPGEDLLKVLWYYNLISGFGVKKIVCPFHRDVVPSMSVDTKKGICFCFGCQTTVDAFGFVRRIESEINGYNDIQAYLKYLMILKSDKCSNIRFNSQTEMKNKYGQRELYNQAHDYYYGLKQTDWDNPDSDARVCADYMEKRGFTVETMKMSMARVSYDARYPVIFPIMDNGNFMGWVKRTNDHVTEKYRKYLYNRGFSRETTLAGNYGENDYVFLVEGYMDMLKFMQYGVKNVAAILGWKITKTQVYKLKASGIVYVISALDNDECGKRGTEYLKNYFRVVRFRYMENFKDPGEMDRKSFMCMCKKTYADFMKMKGKQYGRSGQNKK